MNIFTGRNLVASTKTMRVEKRKGIGNYRLCRHDFIRANPAEKAKKVQSTAYII